ncbi:MAG: DUF1329 domain-containing protein [Myxococcota bacterium]
MKRNIHLILTCAGLILTFSLGVAAQGEKEEQPAMTKEEPPKEERKAEPKPAAEKPAPKAKSDALITAENWTEAAGFKPDLSGLENISGKTIDKNNYKEFRKYIGEGLATLIDKYKLKLDMVNYKRIHPSKGYIEATNKYRGQAKILPTGKDIRKRGIEGYTAGLPFPQPKNGLEVAWNYHYNYNGDDGELYYAVKWVSASRGVEHMEEWKWTFIMRTINRTDIPPIPAIESFMDKGLQYTSMTYALTPNDKKGFGAVYSRSVEPLDQQGHIYVPAMRRVLRNTFGTRGDSWNSTDLLYEDVRGYMGYPEWMEWKLIGKETKFAPMHAGVKLNKHDAESNYDFQNAPHWNPKFKWEPRPVYVLEVTPKISDYPYSKQIIYVDAESYLIAYKETYDKKGELWKVLIQATNDSPNMDELPPIWSGAVVVDVQAEHATVFPLYYNKVNQNFDPSMFTLSNLRKRGR